MPVSKSKRKKKKSPPQAAPRPANTTAFLDDLDFETPRDELDTEAAIAEIKAAGKGFRPSMLTAAEPLIAEAWSTSDSGRRVELLVRALQLCPWCGDAYGLMAMAASKEPDLAAHLWRLAMAAAEFALRAELGQDVFEARAGQFWELPQTRPYMRAGAGLAGLLADTGEHEAAVAQYLSLLILNPEDDQGLRYPLAGCLLVLGNDEILAPLLDEFEDERSAFSLFNRAAQSFRRKGDTAAGRAVLAKALAANPHVAPYLLGAREVPPATAEPMEPGSAVEAGLYVETSLEGWQSIPGALEWVRKHAPDVY
jgi:tetratricopeptide (TPR) repeat protein